MRVKYLLICFLALLLIIVQMSNVAGLKPGEPSLTPKDVNVDPGDDFDLKVGVLAHANGTYVVRFFSKERFSFPDLNFKEHNISKGDAVLFEVPCMVDDDAPDGNYNITFEVSWEYNDTDYSITDSLRVTVGEGAEDDGSVSCESAIIIAGVSVLAFLVLVIKRRKQIKMRE